MAASMENVFLSLSSNFCGKSNNYNDTRHVLSIFDDLHLLQQQKTGTLQDVISHIHNCLNSAKQRLEGLLLLEKLVEQCVTDIFTQNAVVWLRFIIQILQSHDPVFTQKLACHVCGRILDQASDFTILSRDVSALIPQLLTVLLSSPQQWKDSAISCIIACIENFHGACGPYKHKIEAFIIQELDRDAFLSKVSVRCFAVLARCGGSGNLGIKHTEGWTSQCTKLLGSLESTINTLYEGLELYSSSTQINKHSSRLPLKEVPESCTDKLNVMTSRFQMLTACLVALLREPFSATAKVPVFEIMELVARAMSVNSKILKNKTTERLQLFTHLPAVHKSAVSVIEALIYSCKKLLLPFTKQILSLLIQDLIWTHTPVQYGQCKSYSDLRRHVYETLTTWLQDVGVFVETTTEEEDLIDAILHDTKPHMDIVKIDTKGNKAAESTEPPPTKKKKKGGYQEISHGISTQKKVNNIADHELTAAALNVLYWLLMSVGETLKLKSVKAIQDFVIATSLGINQQRGNPGIPYHHSNCRHGLYRVLQACVLVPHPTAPCPLRCIVAIYRMGLLDRDNYVSNYCKECLRVYEAMIHPRAPCLKGPVICSSVINIGNITDNTSDASQLVSSQQKYPILQQQNNIQEFSAFSHEISHGDGNSQKSPSVSTSFVSVPSSDVLSTKSDVRETADSENRLLYTRKFETVKTIEETSNTNERDSFVNENTAGVTEPVGKLGTDIQVSPNVDSKNIASDIESSGGTTEQMFGNLEKGSICSTAINEQNLPLTSEHSSTVGHGAGNIMEVDEIADDKGSTSVGGSVGQHEEGVTMVTGNVEDKSNDEELEDMLSSFKDTDPDI